MSVRVERLVKSYGDHLVVNQVSFEVGEGECFVLLGPSGSGKSTVLRMVAGLVEADAGQVLLHGRNVTRLSPQRRGVGFVFQHYALFGHMTVAENVEFALRLRKVPSADRRRRRDELLELVGLVGLGRRYPQQLSGGQQQRVALARALAHRPEVLLLDEPFGALDARIRGELRRTLRAIQRELAVTTLFVTHDQDEAFELGDRVGVMHFGRLLETGPPHELYLRPQTEFVAAFLGKANLMVGASTPDGVVLGETRFRTGTEVDETAPARRVQVLFRPEDVAVKLTRDAVDWPLLGEGVVDEVEFGGSFERLRLRMPGREGVRPISPTVPFGADHVLIEATRSQHLARRFPLRPGERAWVGVRRVHALPHPGLNVLLFDDGSDGARHALGYGGHLCRLCHARVTALVAASGDQREPGGRQRVLEILGSGLAGLEIRSVVEPWLDGLAYETAARSYDLLVTASAAHNRAAHCEALLRRGEHHLLIVPGEHAPARRALICAAAGEPGKEDVLFAGRLLRHLGCDASILTVTGEQDGEQPSSQVRRFQEGAMRSLALFGIEARALTRRGAVLASILDEIGQGRHDLLIAGLPLNAPGKPLALGPLLCELLASVDVPLLLIRTGERRT